MFGTHGLQMVFGITVALFFGIVWLSIVTFLRRTRPYS